MLIVLNESRIIALTGDLGGKRVGLAGLGEGGVVGGFSFELV